VCALSWALSAALLIAVGLIFARPVS